MHLVDADGVVARRLLGARRHPRPSRGAWLRYQHRRHELLLRPQLQAAHAQGWHQPATATGYNAASYLSAATSGATSTADSIQNPNRTNIRSNLTSYAGNLASWLRTNKPAGTLDDAVGGMTINPHIGGNLRQATLPYQDTSAALTEWTDIAASS